MPNWCSNVLCIDTTNLREEIIIKIVESFNEQNFLFTFVPIPPDKTAISTWGTKWDISINFCEYDKDERKITADFDTAWSPPLEAYRKLSDSLSFVAYFYESGNDFCGKYSSNGEDEIYDLVGNLDNIPKDIIELFDLDVDYEED